MVAYCSSAAGTPRVQHAISTWGRAPRSHLLEREGRRARPWEPALHFKLVGHRAPRTVARPHHLVLLRVRGPAGRAAGDVRAAAHAAHAAARAGALRVTLARRPRPALVAAHARGRVSEVPGARAAMEALEEPFDNL